MVFAAAAGAAARAAIGEFAAGVTEMAIGFDERVTYAAVSGIEVTEAQRRKLQMSRLQRHDRLLEGFGPFQADTITRSKTSDGFVRLPVGRTVQQIGRDSIEIAPPGDAHPKGNRIAGIDVIGACFGGDGELTNGTAEIGWAIRRRKRDHALLVCLTLQGDLLLNAVSEKVVEKGIVEWIVRIDLSMSLHAP